MASSGPVGDEDLAVLADELAAAGARSTVAAMRLDLAQAVAGRLDDRVAAHEREAAGHGLPVVGREVRVALPDHVDPLDGQRELLGRDLREGRVGALAVVDAARRARRRWRPR